MNTKKKKPCSRISRWILFLCLMVVPLSGCEDQPVQTLEEKEVKKLDSGDGLTVHFMDVGQGNAVLAESQGKFMLIDGGPSDSSSFVVSYLKDQGVKELEYVIVSHYDADHVAGIVGVLHAFDVNTLIGPDYQAETKTFRSYAKQRKELDGENIYPETGESYTLGASTFTIVGPEHYDYEDVNDNSVSVRMDIGERSFLICGDAGKESEEDMLLLDEPLDADVYMVSHHGSASSTTEEFLKEVDPEYAVISCGYENSYGHPHEEVVSLLEEEEIELWRTDIQGTIVATCDGSEISWSMEASDNYSPGWATKQTGKKASTKPKTDTKAKTKFVLNTNTKKFHLPECSSAADMKEEHKEVKTMVREELLEQGYEPCKRCNP